MKKIQIIYQWQTLGQYARKAAESLCKGLLKLLWAVMLLAVNLADRAVKTTIKAIRKSPVTAFVVAIAVSTVVYAAFSAQMKCRLTTAEHQRDSLIIKLDSIKVLSGDKVSYFKYQSYK